MRIFECGIYKKGYKMPDQTLAFYFGMGLDELYNYTHQVRLLDEEELFKETTIEISNIEDDSVETKTVTGYELLDDNLVAVPYRIYEVESCEYVHPFYAKDRE